MPSLAHRRGLHVAAPVDNLYTGPTFKDKTGPLLRDRERVATVPGRCVSFFDVRAEVRLKYTYQVVARVVETTQRPVGD